MSSNIEMSCHMVQSFICIDFYISENVIKDTYQGRIQDFKLGGAHLEKSRRAERGAKNFGYFVWKIAILRKQIIFFFSNFRGGGAGCAPLDPPLPIMGNVFNKWPNILKLIDRVRIIY